MCIDGLINGRNEIRFIFPLVNGVSLHTWSRLTILITTMIIIIIIMMTMKKRILRPLFLTNHINFLFVGGVNLCYPFHRHTRIVCNFYKCNVVLLLVAKFLLQVMGFIFHRVLLIISHLKRSIGYASIRSRSYYYYYM